MATLNKPVTGYLTTDGTIIPMEIIVRVTDDKQQTLSLSSFSGLSMTILLKKEIKAELIKALGE
jgi:hypothetical protein